MLFQAFVLVFLGFLLVGTYLILQNLDILTRDAIAAAQYDNSLREEVHQLRAEVSHLRQQQEASKRRMRRIAAATKPRARRRQQ